MESQKRPSEISDGLFVFRLLSVNQDLREDQVGGVAGYGAFVLCPEEGPVVKVLEVVGPVKQDAGSHVAWDGREVCPVVTVEHILGACSTDSGNQRVVVIRMASEEPVSGPVRYVTIDQIGIIPVCVAYGRSEFCNGRAAGPRSPG